MTKTVCVQGLGFVGFAMAVAVANAKDPNTGKPLYTVIGIDRNNTEGENKINQINSGKFPIKCNDSELKKAYYESLKQKNFIASTNNDEFKKADYVIVDINLDVDIKGENSKIDFSNFKEAIKTLGSNIKKDTLVIVETTVPPGTTEKIVYPIIKKIFEQRFTKDIIPRIAHSYERVMPGPEYLSSIINFWRVYAGINEESAILCEKFLSSIINTKEFPMNELSSCTASELSKVLENSYRATNIAFIHEWGIFSEKIGVNLFEILDAIKKRPTHTNIKKPGLGVGGYCLTKDPLMGYVSSNQIFDNTRTEFPITKSAISINLKMPEHTFNKTSYFLKKFGLARKLIVLGLTYRDQVGDIRNSASLDLVNKFINANYEVITHDPMINEKIPDYFNLVEKLPDPKSFGAVIFTVSHLFYQELDLVNWLSNFQGVVIDANNVLNKKNILDLKKNKINLKVIGRGDL